MMDEPSLRMTVAAAAVLLVLAGAWWWRGVLSERAFTAAPPRAGKFELYDALIAFGLCIVGIAAAAGLARHFAPPDLPEQQRVILDTLVMYGGFVPGIVYVLVRAATTMRGGLLGFGLGVGGSAGRVAWLSILGSAGIVVVTMATGQLVGQISLWIGEPAPDIAHETLLRLREDPTGPAALAIIVSAVIIAPLLEEFFFRGVLQTSLLHAGWVRRRWLVIIAASVLFTLIHIPAMMVPVNQNVSPTDGTQPAAAAPATSPAAAPPPAAAQAPESPLANEEAAEVPRQLAWQGLPALFVLSLGLGYLYERTGSLWPPIIVHAFFNALQILVVLFVLE